MTAIAIKLAALFLLIGASIGIETQKVGSQASATDCKIARNGDRHCQFLVDHLVLGAAVKHIELTVSDTGRIITCTRGTRGEFDDTKWHGTCDGDAWDLNLITSWDEAGKLNVFGSITVGIHVCSISPNSSGGHGIRCALASRFMPEGHSYEPPIVSMASPETNDIHHFGFTPSKDNTIRGSSGGSNRRLAVYDDLGASIDIMVVWTRNAECLSNGLSRACTPTVDTEARMRKAIDLAISVTNGAMAESRVLTQLRLVHAYRELGYNETDNWDAAPYNDELGRMQLKTDGFLDDIHAKRALYGADMVHMIAAGKDGGGCRGLGYLGERNNYKDYMFSVSGHNCLGNSYVFAHEIGHNMGANHDRGSDDACGDTVKTNYAHRTASIMTILASFRTGKCDNVTVNVVWAQRYSNPDVMYDGMPTGTATSNNAKKMNEQRIAIAGYFKAMNCQVDADCNDNDASTTDSCNTANAACVFTAGAKPATPVAPTPAGTTPTVPTPTGTTPTVPTPTGTTPTVPTPVGTTPTVPTGTSAGTTPTVPTPVGVTPTIGGGNPTKAPTKPKRVGFFRRLWNRLFG